jgi:hypothetical protein
MLTRKPERILSLPSITLQRCDYRSGILEDKKAGDSAIDYFENVNMGVVE